MQQEQQTQAVPKRSWIRAARFVRDNHAARLVHVPTGRLMSRERTHLAFEYLDEVTELSEEYEREESPKGYECVLLDATTANMLCTVYDALNPANQQKFDGFRLPFAVETGWKFIK